MSPVRALECRCVHKGIERALETEHRRGLAAAYGRVAESIASKEVRGAAERRIAVLEPRPAASDQGKR